MFKDEYLMWKIIALVFSIKLHTTHEIQLVNIYVCVCVNIETQTQIHMHNAMHTCVYT